MPQVPGELPGRPRLFATPRQVEIAITGACNLSCAYCSYGADRGERHPDDLTTEQLVALMEELGQCAVLKVTLTGGEPLLRPDFEEIVAAVVKNRMRFSINTNGLLLTSELLGRLWATRRLERIQVSIDGADAWANDRNRSRGAFEGAIRALRLLKEHGIPRACRVTITRHTADQLGATIEQLLELVPAVGTNELMPFGRGHDAYDKLCMTPQQRIHVTATLVELERLFPGRVQASAGPLAMARETSRVKTEMASGCGSAADGAGRLSSCRGFHENLAIQHDGTILSCIQVPDLPLGKVGQVSIERLWLESELLGELRNRWEVRLESLEYCKGCEYIPYCHGGCPANAMAVFGTHLAPDPLYCLRRLIDGVQLAPEGVVHRRARSVHLRVV